MSIEQIHPSPTEKFPIQPDGSQERASNHLAQVLVLLGYIRSKIDNHGNGPSLKEISNIYDKVEKAYQASLIEEENARIDLLTGLPNRRAFEERVKMELSRLMRTFKTQSKEVPQKLTTSPLYVIAIDLDHFKSINDTFGHSAGDLYLKHVSTKLREALYRKTDFVARFGGDEFKVLIPGYMAEEFMDRVKHRLLQAVKDGSMDAKTELMKNRPDLNLKETEGNVSASIGFAVYNDPTRSFDEAAEQADYYAYLAKALGKDAVVDAETAQELDPEGIVLKNMKREEHQ